ncbi:ECF transporter S component [Cellulomonas sp. 179-A 9B4 NHS]|uniref:ECF transporter S component n=1 Tax=Cellulomonas sp. 179-A 9B4 NHS TaxID=3142379 RepID=UPI00399FF434
MTRWSTRLLLSCAAIGVGGGLVGIPSFYLFTTLATAAPFLMGLAAGFYLLPGMIALAAFRRPGVGFLTTMLAAVAAAPFVPGSFTTIYGWLYVAVLLEVPFALLGYRWWRAPVFYVAPLAGAAFYTWTWWTYYDIGSHQVWAQVALPTLLLGGMLLFTWLARVVAARLTRTGAMRGLQLPEDRRRRAVAGATASSGAPAATTTTTSPATTPADTAAAPAATA